VWDLLKTIPRWQDLMALPSLRPPRAQGRPTSIGHQASAWNNHWVRFRQNQPRDLVPNVASISSRCRSLGTCLGARVYRYHRRRLLRRLRHAEAENGLLTARAGPRCAGIIIDGYCDVCGSPAGAVPVVLADRRFGGISRPCRRAWPNGSLGADLLATLNEPVTRVLSPATSGPGST
jgi:hypothetical protein